MKKTSLALALLATCAMAQADTLSKIAERGSISLAYRESSVPFSYILGSSHPVGLAVDVSDAVADAVRKQLKLPTLKIERVAVTSANRIPLVVNGTVDLECGSTTNNAARGKDVQFAINYFYTGTRLLVKKGSGIRNYADLSGKTVSTTTGTTNLQVMRKYFSEKKIDANMVYGKDHSESFLLVESGRAVAFGMDDILLYGLRVSSKTPTDYEVVGDSLQVEPYACMMRKDDPAFRKLVNGVLGGMMKSGEFNRLYTKWFQQPIPPNNVTLGVPMSVELKDNLKAQSDKPAL